MVETCPSINTTYVNVKLGPHIARGDLLLPSLLAPHADQGVFPLLQECPIVALDEALAPIDLASLGVADYWMCAECGRPSSDLFHDHMQQRRPARGLATGWPLRTTVC